jgi:PIN domain nuclease of toxin-antitoxin system
VKLLLDTHTLFWSIDDPSKVSARALAALQDPANSRLLSAATVWEIAIKVGQGKLKLSMPYRQWLETAIADLVLEILPITVEYGEQYCVLPAHHKDPFDRLMIAQSLADAIPIVGADTAFDAYGVDRIW